MMSLYSRNFLLSLPFWWKFPVRCRSKLTRNREGTLKPLSSSVFEALKTVGMLRRFRGQRGGQLRTSSRFSTSFPSSKSKVLANVADLHKNSTQIFKITPMLPSWKQFLILFRLTFLTHHSTGQRLSLQP